MTLVAPTAVPLAGNARRVGLWVTAGAAVFIRFGGGYAASFIDSHFAMFSAGTMYLNYDTLGDAIYGEVGVALGSGNATAVILVEQIDDSREEFP